MTRSKSKRSLLDLERASTRLILATALVLGLLTSTSAVAIPLGSWNQGSDENEWTTGRTFIARIFDGGSTSTQSSESGEEQGGARARLSRRSDVRALASRRPRRWRSG